MIPMHLGAPRSSLPNGRIRWRRVATASLAAGCVAGAACDGVEPTATPMPLHSLAADADVVPTAKPIQSSLIAYVNGRSGNADVYVMDPTNGRSHRITRDRSETRSPTFAWKP